MAIKHNTVCYFCVVCLLLVSCLLPLTNSSDSQECAEEDVRRFEDFETSPRPKTVKDKELFTSNPGKQARVDLKLKGKTTFIPYTLDVSLTNVEKLTLRFEYPDRTKVDMVVNKPGDRYSVPLEEQADPLRSISLIARPTDADSSVVIEVNELEVCWSTVTKGSGATTSSGAPGGTTTVPTGATTTIPGVTTATPACTNTSNTYSDLLEYTLLDENPREAGPAVHVESFHAVHRTKRQAVPVQGSDSAANSSSSNNNVTTVSPPLVSTPSSDSSTSGSNSSATPKAATTAVSPDNATTASPVGTTSSPPQGNGSSTLPPVIIMDHHDYYMSRNIPGAVKTYFVVMDNPQTHDSLNTAHRLAGVIRLPFTFRFYGHNITSVTIATGGFLYMSPFLHKFLASTQYVAPLMANFHTAASNNSNIFFQHVGDEFVVEWQNVTLKDEEDKGFFIFQTKLKTDGTITFVYKQLPVPLTNISSADHPVKIGLSDAFYNDTHLPAQGIIRRRIIEYHRVTFHPDQIDEGTVIVLQPLPTCNTIEDCKTCAVHKNVQFDCKWCSNVGRCSDGIDWYRQDWENKGCKITAITDSSLCNNFTTPTPATVTGSTTTTTAATATTSGAHNATQTYQGCRNGSCRGRGGKNKGVAAAVTVSVMLAVLLIAVGIWVYYAYTHPTTASGIWLMEHRPSMLRAKLANLTCKKTPPASSSKYAMESTA